LKGLRSIIGAAPGPSRAVPSEAMDTIMGYK
jgi:hypothetical protein